MLAELCSEGKLIKPGGAFRIHNLSVRLSDERERLITMLLDYARESDFVPFSAHTFWKLHKRKFNKNEIQRLLDYLHTQKSLICLNNRRFLTPQAMEQIKKRVKQVIMQKGRLTLADVEKILTKNPLKMAAPPEEIKKQLAPSLDEAPFQRMLAELCSEGKLIKPGGAFRIHNLSVRLSDERERLITMLLDYARESDFVPFSAHTFWKLHKRKFNKNEIQRLLDYLHTQKSLICLNNRRFLTPQAMEQIKKRVKQVIMQKGRLTLADSKKILGYGRTVGVPVLEYLDSIGFTVRQGDERVLTQFKQMYK
ncbi:MAG: hypothetical protein AUJ48_01950 [Deltaproteobacteria bacterium CG1_02_45_11]|nr:MAG: hypothetical protein AUJ48_01950 [Deltaproteobacteria bacterium CG1_02_45_11]